MNGTGSTATSGGEFPDDIIHWDQHAPGGKPTLFVFDGNETCFFPGDGGI